MLVLDIMGCRAAKASPHWLGARCISRAAQSHSRRRARPTGRALSGCARGFSRARSACLGSSRFMAGPVAAGLTLNVGASGKTRRSQGRPVVAPSAGGRSGTCATCARRCAVTYRPQRPSRTWRVLRSVWCPSTAGDWPWLAGHAFAVLGGAWRSQWCRLAHSWGCDPVLGSRWFRAVEGFPHAARGRCRGH